MTDAPIRFRPHHFLCALGFEGKGYSEDFTANMAAIVDARLRAPGGGDVQIEVTATADAICAPCPSRRGAGCESGDRIAQLDAAHARALGLAPGDRISWAEARARMRALSVAGAWHVRSGAGAAAGAKLKTPPRGAAPV